MEQSFKYYTNTYCKNRSEVKLIIICISKGGKIKELTKFDLTFHPEIIKTKKINKQKDLSIIRNKFRNNKLISSLDVSLLITLPLFDIKESECEIIEETCRYIKEQKECIPKEKLDDLIIGTCFNILEYIDEYKQEELMEMIDMATRYIDIMEEIKNEAKEETKANIIRRLLETFSLNEISKALNISKNDILTILNRYD